MAKMSAAQRQRAYRARQKVRMLEDPEYAAQVKDKRREQGLKRLADPLQKAKKLATTRAWYAQKVQEDPSYRGRKNEQMRKWQADNPEKVAASYRKWCQQNDRSEYNLAWARANREKRCESMRRRRALVKGASEIQRFTKAGIWLRDCGMCGICAEPANWAYWHLDHIIPLSKGGAHTMDNVQVSHPKCNLSKSNKILTGGEST